MAHSRNKFKVYTKRKDSGVEWLGDVPAHWEVKAIKWNTPVLRGASPRPIDDPIYFDEYGEYAWVRIADVTASKVYLEETTQRLSDLGSSLSVKMTPGSLFLSIAATVGVPCIANIKCCIHDGFVYFPHLKANTKFMYYIFACGEPYKGLGKLGTQLNLNTDTVGSIVIGFPPLLEQQAIVAYLDRETEMIDTLVAKKKRLVEILREKRTALISHAVTRGLNPSAKLKPSGVQWLGDVPEHWEMKKLKDTIFKLESGVSVNATDMPVDVASIGVLKTSCVYGDNFNPAENKEVWEDDLARVKCGVRKNALIISRMNTPELVGSCGIVEHEYPNLVLPDRLWQTIYNPKYEKYGRFLWYFITSIGVKSYLAVIATGTSASMKNVEQFDFLRIPIALPPLPEQQAIAAFLDRETGKLDGLIAKVETVIEKLKEYRTALISAAVTGKIDVREENEN